MIYGKIAIPELDLTKCVVTASVARLGFPVSDRFDLRNYNNRTSIRIISYGGRCNMNFVTRPGA